MKIAVKFENIRGRKSELRKNRLIQEHGDTINFSKVIKKIVRTEKIDKI